MRLQFLQLLQARAEQLCYFYVYGYRHPITKVWRYIGKGSGRRKNLHLWYAQDLRLASSEYPNPRLIHWIRKLHQEGIEPEIVILQANTSEGDAYALEAELIALIGRTEERGTLYNLDSGGSGGKKVSNETRLKMSEAHLGKPAWNKGKPTPHLGCSPSEETRRKQSIALKGKPSPNKGKPSPNKGKTGHKDSEETRQRKSESHLGRPAWNKGKVDSEKLASRRVNHSRLVDCKKDAL